MLFRSIYFEIIEVIKKNTSSPKWVDCVDYVYTYTGFERQRNKKNVPFPVQMVNKLRIDRRHMQFYLAKKVGEVPTKDEYSYARDMYNAYRNRHPY